MEVGMLPSSTSVGSCCRSIIPSCKIRRKAVAFLASKDSGDFCRIAGLSSPSFRSSENGRNCEKNSGDSQEGGRGQAVAFLRKATQSVKYLGRNWCQMLKLNNWMVQDYYKLVAAVNSLEQSIRDLIGEQLRGKTGEFYYRLPDGAALDSIGAVVTVNDYFAQRDARWMGQNHQFWNTESPVVATKNIVQGISSWVSRRRVKRIAATAERNEEGEEGNEGDEVKEKGTRATTLDQLDQQLATLAEREDSSASRPSLGPSVQQMRPVKRQPGEQSEDGRVAWPEFSAGFLGFLGFAMLLLTVVNNVLFRIFLGPPVVPYQVGDPVQSSVREEPRFRITTRSEEREAREAKVARESTPDPRIAESKMAPSLNSGE